MMEAAFTQNTINSVMHQLRPYNQPVLDATQAAARAITIAVFLCIGIANYAVFGTKLQPDVLLNYSGHGLRRLLPRRPALALAVAVKLSFLVNGLFTLPAYLYPYQHNLWAALPSQSPEHRMNDQRSFAATNIGSLAACTLVAVLVPSIWKPLKLLGGTAVGCMAFVFPGAIALSTCCNRSHAERTAGDRALWVLGWVLLGVGLLQAVASIASQFI
ncbi:sodium-coupled neutral amino acid transporter 7 [Chlorella sorokiniana]|uniref:Sodium-coupled neutral amino acid transporter 7 n=1 Tax=Chlorella sorokiniana TaxID=3076 RepID=A0A2P6TEV3_CHLSO|nr:sodium-coupled neutral amino acid transporter 7 [Chlorella sorokiniana]|eukprot:PRW32504.1 sodium-coupled neutral amino acid transporter 7 [Chlorella sorokiniana]